MARKIGDKARLMVLADKWRYRPREALLPLYEPYFRSVTFAKIILRRIAFFIFPGPPGKLKPMRSPSRPHGHVHTCYS
jgi:hypothetical protein